MFVLALKTGIQIGKGINTYISVGTKVNEWKIFGYTKNRPHAIWRIIMILGDTKQGFQKDHVLFIPCSYFQISECFRKRLTKILQENN